MHYACSSPQTLQNNHHISTYLAFKVSNDLTTLDLRCTFRHLVRCLGIKLFPCERVDETRFFSVDLACLHLHRYYNIIACFYIYQYVVLTERQKLDLELFLHDDSKSLFALCGIIAKIVYKPFLKKLESRQTKPRSLGEYLVILQQLSDSVRKYRQQPKLLMALIEEPSFQSLLPQLNPILDTFKSIHKSESP